jgi:hypothetical protein
MIFALEDAAVVANELRIEEERLSAERERIVNERIGLENQLLQLEGNTAELRQRQLNALDPTNRALQENIWLLEDQAIALDAQRTSLDNAMSALERAVQSERQSALTRLQQEQDALMQSLDNQRNAVTIAMSVAQESVGTLGSLFDYISGQIRDINQEVDASRSAAQGMQFISEAVLAAQRTGYLPDQEQLSEAVSAARGGLSAQNFATSFEMRRSNLRLANELGILGSLTGDQLTTAEKQLLAQESTLERLDLQIEEAQTRYDLEVSRTNDYYDQILENAQKQFNALVGIDDSVMSVENAIQNLQSAMANFSRASAAVANSKPTVQPEQNVAGASGYRLVGNTLYFPGGGSHSVGGDDGQQLLIDTYGLVQTENGLIRTRAEGGYTPAGMTLVGERGPELVDFNRPAQVYTNNELRSAMGGGDSSEIRGLREENRAQSRAMVSLQARMTRLLEKWDGDGLPQDRYEGETV